MAPFEVVANYIKKLSQITLGITNGDVFTNSGKFNLYKCKILRVVCNQNYHEYFIILVCMSSMKLEIKEAKLIFSLKF